MTQWQYLVAPIAADAAKREALLTHCGTHGWELVAVAVPNEPMAEAAHIAYFKRPMGTGPDANAREAMYR